MKSIGIGRPVGVWRRVIDPDLLNQGRFPLDARLFAISDGCASINVAPRAAPTYFRSRYRAPFSVAVALCSISPVAFRATIGR